MKKRAKKISFEDYGGTYVPMSVHQKIQEDENKKSWGDWGMGKLEAVGSYESTPFPPYTKIILTKSASVINFFKAEVFKAMMP